MRARFPSCVRCCELGPAAVSDTDRQTDRQTYMGGCDLECNHGNTEGLLAGG